MTPVRMPPTRVKLRATQLMRSLRNDSGVQLALAMRSDYMARYHGGATCGRTFMTHYNT